MLGIDINCDMGEGFDNDEALMQYVSSVNIACGFHAGNEATMQKTVERALLHNVAIGAHPGFDDKENFGRKNINLSPQQVYAITLFQVNALLNIVNAAGAKLTHVKPHGALYNMAASNAAVSKAIAEAVKAIDDGLILVGLSGTHLVHEARVAGLQARNEVFADRTYTNEGLLTPRSQVNALIENEEHALKQAMQMIMHQSVTSTSGKIIPLVADTVCIHGDGKHALEFAKKLCDMLGGKPHTLL